jgi:pimeloyl-ACP methyl ester carboxylesterase
MKRVFRITFGSLLVAALFAVGALAGAVAWARYGPPPLTVRSGAFPEEVVYVKSEDGIVNAGMIFAPPKSQAKAVAIIWLHGWGVNFYSPTYVTVGRALAERGLTTISVNTRMHDLGTVAGHRFGKRIRGGGYWGVTSEGSLDIAAWVNFAEEQGFERVVLVGHSAGWSAVAAYEIQRHDPRVAGMVLASGAVQVQRPERDARLMAEATRLVQAGSGDELIRLPTSRSPPTSAPRHSSTSRMCRPRSSTFLDLKPKRLASRLCASRSSPSSARVKVMWAGRRTSRSSAPR